MKNRYQTQHATQLNRILAALPKSSKEALRRFVAQFYAKMPISDLAQYDPKQAVALALSAYDFMREREPGAPKIRIFTPDKQRHGYEKRSTVIELLNDDMPFLVDSLTAELTRHGYSLRDTIHPILKVKRDKKGALQDIVEAEDTQDAASWESLIHFEISAIPGTTHDELASDLAWVLQHIRVTVEDWKPITDKVVETIESLDKAREHFVAGAISEVRDFLHWLLERNFVFMGYAQYEFFDGKGKEKLAATPGSKLGILKITDDTSPQGIESLPPESRQFLLVPQLIEITKSNRRSPVHRPVPMDYIGVKRFDKHGKVIGEARFLGLFTSNVYYQSAEAIPLVRQKIAHVLARSDFDPASHDGKALKAILEFLPRDEIFQMSHDDLFEISMGILALEAKPGVRAFIRRDAFERFVSAMVFVPRELFSTELRRQIQSVIEQAFNGASTSFTTQITEAPLARLHVIVKTTPGDIPSADTARIEHEIARRAYLWGDLLLEALLKRHDELKAEQLLRDYANAFPQSYINRYDAIGAVHDIEKIGEAIEAGGLALELFRHKGEDSSFVHLKIYNPNEEIALSDILPLLENAGFRVIEEHPFPITPHGSGQIWIRDIKLQAIGDTLPFEQVRHAIEEALLHTWRQDAENDRFNALVLRAGLSWQQAAVLRAYAKYLKQAGFTYAQATIEQAMNQQPGIARNLIALFETRFAPDVKDREPKQQAAQAAIEAQLADVTNLVEDRILRRYGELILTTLRTNYYQSGEAPKPVLSFKFDSSRMPELPLPRPFAEIFVYGTRVEGIHLRGGKVARGGLRWSDRHEDFRTEVLGLMKAQMVKNSVIVPVGSKGGFVVKRPPQEGGREALLQEGIACYTMYLQGLLDVTDNIIDGNTVPPISVVRHDEDDPYLVVAADKGTATFSDIANGVSAQYGFWLGDAFASGGSAGYDHKEMGITARGAWVSVTRHFREMGVDISQQDFTVVGIGDMSGDVFGNGMLLSNHIRLVAAFNHMHIFIDPNPDAPASFQERERLFHLPRSTWKDYNAALISKGGGVYERSAKTIMLSKEALAALGMTGKATLTPDEVIRAILLAPVDLLWNGGIGTYVKAEDETHDQVGDRANNAVRVNGRDLRCKIAGEGGNLGFTQKGRIEYARRGGRINTDAIDNSAGVDCSDHEVNIKIAFSQLLAGGQLTLARRDKLLVSMTDEVARLVLKDNQLQTQAITIAQQQGFQLLESQIRLMQKLEREGMLDRAIEFLPGDKQLTEMKAAQQGMTRPELAVLLAYSKMVLYREILESGLPDEPYFKGDLNRYFPKAMQQQFIEAIERHPLRREIIATVVTNSMINRAGITFFFDIAEDLGLAVRDIAAAYALARDAFGLRTLWKEIEATESSVAVSVQAEMYAATSQFLERVTVWLLRNLPLPLEIERAASEIMPAIADIEQHQQSMHSEITRQHAHTLLTRLREQGVPSALAEKIASLELMSSAFDIIAVAHQTKKPVELVGKSYFDLGARLNLGWLRRNAAQLATVSHWERLAVKSLINDLYDEQRRLASAALTAGGIEVWLAANQPALQRYDRFIDDLKTGDSTDIARLMVTLRHVRSL